MHYLVRKEIHDMRNHRFLVLVALVFLVLAGGCCCGARTGLNVPDIERIAFDRTKTGFGTDIWIMDGVGGSPRRVTTAARPDVYPAFSPDGLRLAYSSEQLFPPTLAIFTINVDGTGAAPLVRGTGNDEFLDVRWSADGRQLAYSFRGGIWLHDFATNTQRRLTPEGVHATWPSFGPDGIYFARVTGTGTMQIWRINPATGAMNRFLGTPDGSDQPAWTSDGTRMFFHFAGNIERTDRALGHFPTVITDGSQPAPSPSGRRLAFVRAGQIWTADIDGNFVNQATDGPTDAHPVWSMPIPQ
jgi:TolB protein